MSTTTTKPKNTELAKAGATGIATIEEPKRATDAFVAKLQRNFQGAGEMAIRWSDMQARLAQHLAVKVEMTLEAAEIKRQSNSRKKDEPPFTWANVNMDGLMIQAKNVVDLELDAAMPNHVNVVARLNSRTKKYDVALQPGYEGIAHSRRKFALFPPVDVICKLVFEGDQFEIVHNEHGGETVYHKAASYFRPGEVVGGYGEIKFANPALNRVIITDEYEFEKAINASQSKDFWGGDFQEKRWNDDRKAYDYVGEFKFDPKFRRDMQFKTVVLRTYKHVKLDPAKVNTDAYLAIEATAIGETIAEVGQDIAENANEKELPAPASAPEQTEGAEAESNELF